MAKDTTDPMDEIFAELAKTYKDSGKPIDLDNPDAYSSIEFRRSGCLAFDWIAANHNPTGGLPRGKIVEISGPEGCGKTTLCNVIAAATQKYKNRSNVLYVDFEAKYNIDYARDVGVKSDKMRLFVPEGVKRGEAGCKALLLASQSKKYGVAICDSMTAIIPKEELAGELEDAIIGRKAMLQSRTITKISSSSHHTSPTVIFINQIREKIGVVWGSSEETTGARALKFFAILRIDVRARAKIEDERGNVIGQTVQLKANKNQAGRPFMKTEIDMLFGIGYDNTKWCIEKALELGVILKQKKKRLVHNFDPEWYQGSEDQVDMTLDQLTEMFSYTKPLNALYEACVRLNNMEYQKLCDERRSRRERVLAVEAKESNEPSL